MKTNIAKRNLILIFATILLIIIGIAFVFNTTNFSAVSVYAKEFEEIINRDEMNDENLQEEEQDSDEFENIMMLDGGGGRSDGEVIITGSTSYPQDYPISEFTNVKYIPNANFIF